MFAVFVLPFERWTCNMYISTYDIWFLSIYNITWLYVYRIYIYMYTFVNLPSREKQQTRRVIHGSIIKSTGALGVDEDHPWESIHSQADPAGWAFRGKFGPMGKRWMRRAPKMKALAIGHLKFGSLFFWEKFIGTTLPSINFQGIFLSLDRGIMVFFFGKKEVVAQFWCLERETNSKIRPTDLGCSIYTFVCKLYLTIHSIYAQQWWWKVFSPGDCLEDVDCPWRF